MTEVDTALKVFGAALGEPAVEADVAEEPVVESVVEAVPATADPPGTVTEAPAEPEEILDLEGLRAVAEKRKGNRDQKSAAESRARELEARLQQVEQTAAQNARAAEAFRALQQKGKADPIGLLETLGIDVVPFLQSGHRQAIDRQGFQAKTEVQQLKEEVLQLREEVAIAKAAPVEIAQHQEHKAAAARHRQEFIALTEAAEVFPLLAAEPPTERLQLAQRVAEALAEAEVEDITHELVAKTAEKELRRKYDKLSAALGRGTTPEGANEAGTAGRATPTGRPTGTSTTRPKTIRQSHAAEPATPREKTPQERERAAEAILSRMFGRT